MWPTLSLCRTTSHSKKGTRSASSQNPQRGPQETSRGIDAEEELKGLGEKRGGVRQQGEADSSVFSIKSEEAKGTLKNLPGIFVLLSFCLCCYCYCYSGPWKLGGVTHKKSKGQGDFLEVRRYSPASHLPHCPADHSGKAGLTRSMGINNILIPSWC